MELSLMSRVELDLVIHARRVAPGLRSPVYWQPRTTGRNDPHRPAAPRLRRHPAGLHRSARAFGPTSSASPARFGLMLPKLRELRGAAVDQS